MTFEFFIGLTTSVRYDKPARATSCSFVPSRGVVILGACNKTPMRSLGGLSGRSVNTTGVKGAETLLRGHPLVLVNDTAEAITAQNASIMAW